MFHYEGTETWHGNSVTEEYKASSSGTGRNQRLVNEEVKCDMRVRLNHPLKDMKLWRETYAKILTVTVQCTCLCMHNKHTTVSQEVVSHFVPYMSNATVIMFSMPSASHNLYVLPVFAQGCGLPTMQRRSLTDIQMMSGRFGRRNMDFFFSMNVISLRGCIQFYVLLFPLTTSQLFAWNKVLFGLFLSFSRYFSPPFPFFIFL